MVNERGSKDWKKTNTTVTFKEGKRKDWGNYRLVSFTSVSGKLMKNILQEIISKHIKDKKVIGSSQHGFAKGKSSLTNLRAFHNDVTTLVDEGRVLDVD